MLKYGQHTDNKSKKGKKINERYIESTIPIEQQ